LTLFAQEEEWTGRHRWYRTVAITEKFLELREHTWIHMEGLTLASRQNQHEFPVRKETQWRSILMMYLVLARLWHLACSKNSLCVCVCVCVCVWRCFSKKKSLLVFELINSE
jgi:hypothetical protein